ncbi:pseudouridine synthase [Virgibacillus sp. W0181]|uniref:pseudouridine synthase n=1 Tax=Virgibacillus sp. W0181 TaxID=3391581 RepID=UPI003F44DD29
MSESLERLQKVIAQSGITSRRKAEQFILDGRVKVNDEVTTVLGTKVSLKDKIVVDGVPLEKEAPVYYMLYKPKGVISSVKDDKNRKVVMDYLAGIDERVFPIGRLDYDTSGLILLTNDGEFAHLLMHPKHEIKKVYMAKIKGIPSKKELSRLRKGVISNNERLKAIDYNIVSTDKKANSTVLEITLHEGKNRHVKRMMEQLGYPVLKLKREKYGMLTLKGLKTGTYRELTPYEVKQMRNMANQNVKQ